ncbi:MAG: UDP-2,3-diacylglucosamine diphosphatase [Bacteroidales bacterium]|nr:UDP-2,3-diacylglucosamine diphosphatase [Bacteroidales bacterium]MDD4214190.1 UDP-2,3-diacylglucosamine diphosphatase [Bacteroidales bacterium]
MIPEHKKIYFVSDCHFGIPDYQSSQAREKKFVLWLDDIKKDAHEIYILGDLFDYWFEYKSVVPRGYTRLLGKLAELSDSGIKIYYFTGNHDMWTFGYLKQEIGLEIIYKPVVKEINGLKFMLAHGDGLGPGDFGYKMMKKIFLCKLCRWLYARLHPNFAAWVARHISNRSRFSHEATDMLYRGDDKEYLLVYAKKLLKKEHFDFFIFGHRHLPLDVKISENTRYINLGDWLVHFSYAVLDRQKFEIKRF